MIVWSITLLGSSRSIGSIVNVVRVDSNEDCTCLDQTFSRVFGEEGMTLEVLITAPVT